MIELIIMNPIKIGLHSASSPSEPQSASPMAPQSTVQWIHQSIKMSWSVRSCPHQKS